MTMALQQVGDLHTEQHDQAEAATLLHAPASEHVGAYLVLPHKSGHAMLPSCTPARAVLPPGTHYCLTSRAPPVLPRTFVAHNTHAPAPHPYTCPNSLATPLHMPCCPGAPVAHTMLTCFVATDLLQCINPVVKWSTPNPLRFSKH